MLALVQVEIIDEISNNLDGISFNQLVRRMKLKVSRVTLLKELRLLTAKGYVKVENDPRHKQRKLFRLGEELHSVIGELRSIEQKMLDNPIHHLSDFLSFYVEKIRELKDDWMKDFVRHRLRHGLERALRKMEEVV
ncbi:MAG: helix-turn-helix domain-containing protein [Methanomassiliicoccales archaeon]|jgi:DNA-binding HxlR family transcriptional regulator|nr:helix-turn-helix domain-containing protein [Methanomassiliicoccales archaeon]